MKKSYMIAAYVLMYARIAFDGSRMQTAVSRWWGRFLPRAVVGLNEGTTI